MFVLSLCRRIVKNDWSGGEQQSDCAGGKSRDEIMYIEIRNMKQKYIRNVQNFCCLLSFCTCVFLMCVQM